MTETELRALDVIAGSPGRVTTDEVAAAIGANRERTRLLLGNMRCRALLRGEAQEVWEPDPLCRQQLVEHSQRAARIVELLDARDKREP